MKPRFQIMLMHSGLDDKGMYKMAYNIKDNDAKQYNMPENACTINMSRLQAIAIYGILNQAWAEFINNPW